MVIHYPEFYGEIWADLAEMTLANYTAGYEDTCVILCPHRIMDYILYCKNLYKGKKIIVYNFEPAHDNHCISKEWLMQSFENADEIWDYDIDNVEFWKTKGITAKWKPIQYVSSLRKAPTIEKPDIDVLFIGSPSERRTKYFTDFNFNVIIPQNELDEHIKYKFVTAWQVWGDLKHEFTSRSKIILDFALFDGAPSRQERIYYDLINNKCVLSEKSPRNYFDDLIIEFDSPTDLAAKIRYLVRDDNWKKYTNYSFEEYCIRKYK
jgi:hypothetical protein